MKKVIKTLKRDNLKDGRKAHNDSMLIKVGRIRQNSWAHEKLKAADIYIDETELVHINNRHGKELETINFTPLSFVVFVVQNFNEVYSTSEADCYRIVFKQQKTSSYAIMTLSFDGKLYKIKTAAPIKTKQLLNKNLLCAKDH